MVYDALPPDPFAGDPHDPARAFADDEPDRARQPLPEAERAEVLADLADLAVYQALLEPLPRLRRRLLALG